MTEKTEFHSICPVLGTENQRPNVEKSGRYKLLTSKNDQAEVVPSNTNAKDHNSGDKLKLLFRDRHGTKSLSEQKVNDWLYKNRSFYDSVPKDLTEIPDAIWAPQEGTKPAEPAAADLTGNNTGFINEGANDSSQPFLYEEKVMKKTKKATSECSSLH
uniref:Uncharacterized protein n=1 Tax=Schistocephalus solidus TaxID=70667 RepID=A0A0X3PTJ5_SCHSO